MLPVKYRPNSSRSLKVCSFLWRLNEHGLCLTRKGVEVGVVNLIIISAAGIKKSMQNKSEWREAAI